MNTTSAARLPRTFWIVAVLATLWNLIGLAMFWLQASLSPEALAGMSAGQREVLLATPAWINVAYALAVIGGVLGGIGLLLRRRWAVAMFALSLAALLAQVLGTFALTPAWRALGAMGLVFPVLLLVIASALLGFARRALARGWLR